MAAEIEKLTPQETDYLRIETWAVSVDVNAETILTIGSNHLSGVNNIEDYRQTIINCAKHLLAFVGEPEVAVNADAATTSQIISTPWR